jgi:putative membrane protein
MKRRLIQVLVTAVALDVAARVVPGIYTGHWTLHGTSAARNDAQIATTLIIVAVIFGLVNAIIKKPISGCLAFGLVEVLANGALLYLTSYLAYDRLHLPFHVTTWFAAVLGALIVSAVSLIMERILGLDRNKGGIPPTARPQADDGSSPTGGWDGQSFTWDGHSSHPYQ